MSEKLMSKYQPIVDGSGVFNLVSVSSARQHPQQCIITRGSFGSGYTDGRPVSKRKGNTAGRFRCAYPGSRQSLPDERPQQVLFLRLTRNITCSEAKAVLGKIADAVDETDGLVGFTLLKKPMATSSITYAVAR